jgi:N-acetyl-gamma-glutamylphosphate reductase
MQAEKSRNLDIGQPPGVKITRMGHPEHSNAVVSSSHRAIAVIDTGGDYRLTLWCEKAHDWCGREVIKSEDFGFALTEAIRWVQSTK